MELVFQVKLYPALLKILCINNHGILGRQFLTVYKTFYTPFFSGLPESESQYQSSSEQGEFRMREDMSH